MTRPARLHGAPMTCSLAVHAALREFDLPFEIVWLERGPGRRITGEAFARVNPKRKVPSLTLASGETLTEIVSILAHLDATHGPSRDPATRRRLLEWLAYLATDLHQSVFGALFDDQSPAAAKAYAVERLLPPVLAHVDLTLTERPFLVDGPGPSVADFYLAWGLLLVRAGAREATFGAALRRFLRTMLTHPAFVEARDIELERYTRARDGEAAATSVGAPNSRA